MGANDIVESLSLAFHDDRRKAKYLGYLASGFSIHESTQLGGTSISSLRRWRLDDPSFIQAEEHCKNSITRKAFALDFA